MTITAHRIRSPIGRVDRHSFVLEGKDWKLWQVVAAVIDPEWPAEISVDALIDGELVVGARDSSREIPPGSDVTISPTFQGTGFVHGFYAIKKIWKATRKPKIPTIENPEISPTYNFHGIGTQKGAGSPIAIGYGEMRVGQQFITSFTVKDPTARWTDAGKILVQVAMGVGPWNAIGGLDLGLCGEADYLGGDNVGFRPLPAGLRINDAEIQTSDFSVVAHVRSGSLGQSPMPHGLDDVSTVYGLTNYVLLSGIPRIYTTAGDSIDRLVLDWRFPQGLYTTKDGRQLVYVCEFDVRFRKSGQTVWGPASKVVVDRKEAAPGDSSWTQTYDLPEVARWEVEVTRTTPDDVQSSGGDYTVSTSNLETVIEQRLTRIAYPNIAVLGLEVQGNERLDGDLTSVTVPCQMRKIRRNNSGTWSTREYVNATDSTKITGKNLAWIVADLITLKHYGGGALGYEDADIDVTAFEAWADYCDERVPIDGGDEARHECSIYFDSSDYKSLDAAIEQVCTAGRAVYIREGSQHTVVFDGVKERSMLISGERVGNVALTYLNPTGRPTSYVMQILDQDSDWDLLEVPVEDVEAKIDVTSLDRDQLWQERVNLKGVTRRTEAVREAGYRHRVNFYRDLEVSFEVTRWAVPLTIYDRFALSLHVPRWHSSIDGSGNVVDDGWPVQCRTTRATSAGNTIYLDREFNLDVGDTWVVEIQANTGGVDVVEVRNVVGTLPLYVFPDRGLVIDGAQVVIGKSTKTTIDFLVTSKTINPESLKQTITAERYNVLAYDEIAADAPAGTGEDVSEIAVAPVLPTIDRAAPVVDDVRAELTPMGDALEVRWTRPTAGRGHRYRVYRREVGGAWSMHAETSEERARIEPTRLGVDYEISVSSKATGGTWSGPDTGTQLALAGQEFSTVPPPDVVGLSTRTKSTGFEIVWTDVPSQDVDYYEVRRGPQWFGAPVVGRTRSGCLHVEDARIWAEYGGGRGENYMVRARHRNGLLSPNAVGGRVQVSPPDGFTFDVVNSLYDLDLAGAATGTMVGCFDDSSTTPHTVRMSEGFYEASYTLPEEDPGSSTQRWWSMTAGVSAEDTSTLEELGDLTYGELHARTVEGRDPSPQKPGEDNLSRSDDATILAASPAYGHNGRVGVLGHEVEAITQLRVYDHVGASWGGWADWTADIITAQKVQGRVLLRRRNLRHDVALTYVQLIRAN